MLAGGISHTMRMKAFIRLVVRWATFLKVVTSVVATGRVMRTPSDDAGHRLERKTRILGMWNLQEVRNETDIFAYEMEGLEARMWQWYGDLDPVESEILGRAMRFQLLAQGEETTERNEGSSGTGIGRLSLHNLWTSGSGTWFVVMCLESFSHLSSIFSWHARRRGICHPVVLTVDIIQVLYVI